MTDVISGGLDHVFHAPSLDKSAISPHGSDDLDFDAHKGSRETMPLMSTEQPLRSGPLGPEAGSGLESLRFFRFLRIFFRKNVFGWFVLILSVILPTRSDWVLYFSDSFFSRSWDSPPPQGEVLIFG